MVSRQAAFLLKDGSIVDLDGNSNLHYESITIQHSLFVVLYHRNHLAVISANSPTLMNSIYTYNFTTGEGQAYNSGLKDLGKNSLLYLYSDFIGIRPIKV